MQSRPPKQPSNTRDNLPQMQTTNLVPMSAEDFARQKNRKIVIWVAGVSAVVLLAVVGLWWVSSPVTAHKEYSEASKEFNAGRYPEALEAVNRSIQGGVNLADSYQMRGTIYRIMNQPAKAAADLTKVIELRPEFADNYRLRGMAYKEAGNLPKALADFDKLVDLKPSAQAYNLRGACYRDSGNMAKAIEDFGRSIDLEPNVDNYMQRGMALAAKGDHRRALDDFNKALEIRTDVPYLYQARANSRDAMGDRAGATADRAIAAQIESPARVAPPVQPPKKQ